MITLAKAQERLQACMCAEQVMKLGGLEILDGWMDGDVEVLAPCSQAPSKP